MPNPFNPLDWLQSAQDWFTKSERSSGFRPYLIFLILVFGFSIFLLTYFENNIFIRNYTICLLSISSLFFIILFFIKSFQEPDFCRSETHIQTLKKIELEVFGSESEQIEAEIIEQAPTLKAPSNKTSLPLETKMRGAK